MRVFGSYKYDFNGRKRNLVNQKEKSVSNMSRLSFRNTNQQRRMQQNARQRQNATRQHLLLQERQEATNESPSGTRETSLSASPPSTNPTQSL